VATVLHAGFTWMTPASSGVALGFSPGQKNIVVKENHKIASSM
jgi:hypothetical protein